MRNERMRAVLAAVAAGCACTCFATTYFVDNAGNDALPGTSPAMAWQSLERVARAEIQPGDRVLFRRGGLWRGTLDVKSGEEDNRTYYGAYGTGPKPILQGSVARSRREDWEQVRPGVWGTLVRKPSDLERVIAPEELLTFRADFQDGARGRSEILSEEGDKFQRFTCVRPAKSAGKMWTIQFWGRPMQGTPLPLRLRFKVRGDFIPSKMRTLVHVGGANWHAPFEAGLKVSPTVAPGGWRDASVVFADGVSRFCGKGALHFYLGEEADKPGFLDVMPLGGWRIESDPSRVIGRDVGILLFNGGEAWGVKKWSADQLKDELDYWYDKDLDRVLVRLDRNPAERFGSVELAKTWTLVSHGGRHDVTVEALTLRYTGGFCFSGGFAKNFTVRNCDMYFVGGGLQYWAKTPSGGRRPVRYGNAVEYWSPAKHCRVERCRFWQVYDAAVTPQQSGSANGFDDIVFSDNVFWQCEYNLEFWNGATNSHTRAVSFVHNTCVDAGRAWSHAQRPDPNGAHMMCYHHRSPTRDFIVRDNVFCRSSDRGFRFFTDWRSSLSLDYNLHYEPENVLSQCQVDPGEAGLAWKFGPGAAEFARYQKATGLDAHSVYADPQFVNPAVRDYRLRPGSPGTAAASDGGPVGARNMPGLDRDQSVEAF